MKKAVMERRDSSVEYGLLSEELPQLRGYACVFDREYVVQRADGSQFREVFRPGAFTKTLSEQRDIKALYAHSRMDVLGRTGNGTLRLREDAIGLAFEVDLPETTLGRDIRVLVKRRDLTGMSLGFRVPAGKERATRGRGKELELREVLEAQLVEITVTAFPASEATQVEARADAAEVEVEENDGHQSASTDEPGAGLDEEREAVASGESDGPGDHSDQPRDPRLAAARLRLAEAELKQRMKR